MSDSDVEADDNDVIIVRNDIMPAAEFRNDLEGALIQIPLKRKRGNSEKRIPTNPDVNGILTIIVHLITSTSAGDQLTKSRKSLQIVIQDAAVYIQNVNLLDARKNVLKPCITSRNAHGIVVNHFGQHAAETLSKIANAYDPYLSQKLKINSNPEYLVRLSLQCQIFNEFLF